ncbi:MAG: LysR family transcriptional regulator [Dysosmobacter welbionis]|jgi:DNA-binding transcriptional LysR family regulator|uniref:LysR family transcriptional regulator n=1 Tax=Dysosmobacter welbionis TaxID=2093857 RepID=UPI003995CE8B
MNLNHLQYFLETCRYGSITKASEVCHISQPSITAAINNLEKELGAKLFDRVNNRLRLTVVGEGFKDLTEEFLKTFDDYCQSAYDIASSRYTKIRVGIPPFLSTIITKKLFPEFSVQHPNIRLEIVEVGLIDGLNKLNSSQLDCLIGVCRSKTFTCNSRCLFTTKLTLAVNRGSELVHRHKAISIAQMESIPLVTPVKGSYLYSLINEILASEKPNIVMQSNQLTTLKYMLRVDCAAAIIYDGLFNDNEDIVHIPFEEDIFFGDPCFLAGGTICLVFSEIVYVLYLKSGFRFRYGTHSHTTRMPRINIHFADVLMQRRDMSEAPSRKISVQRNAVFFCNYLPVHL